jgi:ABC-type amino acid transport substrate-binding protein
VSEGRWLRLGPLRVPARATILSWRDLALSLGPIILITGAAIWAAFWFVQPAPPDTIVLTAGPDGSIYRLHAEKYRSILARNGVKLEILPSRGSLENLKRLNDPAFRVDVGFVQSGIADGTEVEGLVSLGSMFRQPLAVFYRSAARVARLSQLEGRRLAIGQEGSGTRALALALLKANGIEPGGRTPLLALSGDAAVQALAQGKVDAAFLMGDSAAAQGMRKLLHLGGIRLLDFPQADAYVSRFRYLSKLEIPMGAIDLGRNVPPRNLHLIGPTVELIAREDLHPALSDLLIEAAVEVHGGASVLQRAGEFPAPVEREFPISSDAARYYKSGKGLLYRHLPFWLASLADRTMVVIVPVVVLLIPGLRLVPVLYRWRVASRIYRWYGALLAIERDVRADPGSRKTEELLDRLGKIEQAVGAIRVPLAFADQLYVLREHIGFVRARLEKNGVPQTGGETP